METKELTEKQKQKAISKYVELENLKPLQVELLRLQEHLEDNDLKTGTVKYTSNSMNPFR